jgi:hypothetical protein
MFTSVLKVFSKASGSPSVVAAALVGALTLLASGCGTSSSGGIAESQPAATTVKMDFFHKPLPEIPMPNDIATVVDPSSPTRRRINASMIAPTGFERRTRELADQLDGWGAFMPITIPFTGPIDVRSVRAGHRDPFYETENDVVYVINIDPKSPEFGKLHHVDIGNGNYPVALERRDNYWDNDTRSDTVSILFEEVDEDLNDNGLLDPGEDTDADGVLDKPNYYPGMNPSRSDLAGRVDALMTFYESETNTLIVRLMKPLKERTTYAVVVTRRIRDIAGNPVGSPYPTIHHTAQTEALKPLASVLPHGLTLKDVAFAFTFTTQSMASQWRAVRDGLYGYGVQRHLATEFPPKIDALLPLRDAGPKFPTMTRPYLYYGENWIETARPLAQQFLGLNPNSQEYRELAKSLEYIDYFVIGEYVSPQLFPRRRDAAGNLQPLDGDGDLLPLNDQSWPPDLDRVPAPAYPEKIYVTIAVPRKEVSVRGNGRPAPAAILSHGYGGNRFPIVQLAGFFARHGMATIAIDGPSHGIGLDPDQEQLARQLLGLLGYSGFANATLLDRAFDQNRDGIKDSGADFWTSYLFHTRDIVRQFMLDYSQLVRIMRSWDGRQTWDFDLGEDGVVDIAGDFDGDGAVDLGGDAPILMTGGSLGGIMSMVMGGAEPQITAITPIAGGGGYLDMGMRTVQGGAIEAFVLRMMGPLFTGVIDNNTGSIQMQIVVPQLNDDERRPLGSVAGVRPGDTLVVENLASGVNGCGLVMSDGRVRASLQADRGDRVRLVFYQGSQRVENAGFGCRVPANAPVRGTLEVFGSDFVYQGEPFRAGEPLRAIEDGLGRARNTPEVRRLQSFAGLILDPGDPAAYGPHLMDDPIVFATGERTGAHAMVITTQGDMNVPASSGSTYGRAAGLIQYLQPNPRLGHSENQLLIDTYTNEAVDNLKRFTDSSGAGVHIDVENFSNGNDLYGPTYPRLDPPLRIGFDRDDKLGGKSAALFVLSRPQGQHGFDFPGVMTDQFRAKCQRECNIPGSGDPCNCRNQTTYDVGSFMFNMLAHYMVTNGQELNYDLCNSDSTCDYIPQESPPQRNTAQLP